MKNYIYITMIALSSFTTGCFSDPDPTFVPDHELAPVPTPSGTEEVAPSCGESNGLCRNTCYGMCDDIEDFSGKCEGSCEGACCT